MTDDRDPGADVDALLRAALASHDLPAARIAAVRSRAHDELRRASDRRRRAARALEATAAFALGAAQVAWAIIAFLDRPS
ncbi:MAG TPA: hypothetical protein VM734_33780 [Kofleriaceae bacterium]|nr:hypothetical protein [Kofleriaceae bacterium]